jgi:hypothetical protein
MVDNSLILQHSPSRGAIVRRKYGIEVAAIYFNTLRLSGFELETFDSDTMLSYYKSISYTQKSKLMGNGGQFTYTSTLPSCTTLVWRKRGIVRL